MSEPYVYTDPYGCRLRIDASPADKADIEITFEDATALDIPAADLPTIVAEMYKAAGQVPPILLPRYEHEKIMTRDGKVRAAVIPSGEDMTPADALDIASWYATAAEKAAFEALSQSDPAQVEALAEVIEALADGSTSDVVARAILAAGYAKAGES